MSDYDFDRVTTDKLQNFDLEEILAPYAGTGVAVLHLVPNNNWSRGYGIFMLWAFWNLAELRHNPAYWAWSSDSDVVTLKERGWFMTDSACLLTKGKIADG